MFLLLFAVSKTIHVWRRGVTTWRIRN